MQLLSVLGIAQPVVVVHNKLSDEWDRGPVHNIPDDTLQNMVQVLHASGWHVVYVRATGHEAGFVTDDNLILPGDRDLHVVRANHGTVLQDVMNASNLQYNVAQMQMSAVARAFVSVQGGPSVLASYFGGTNIVYAKEGVEARRGLYQKGNLFSSLAGTQIRVCTSLEALSNEISALKP